MQGHLGEVVEAVADHELGVLAARTNDGIASGGMLPVGVDHEHGVGAASTVDAGANGRRPCRFAPAAGRAAPELFSECVELLGDVGPRAVVDDHERVDVLEHRANECGSGTSLCDGITATTRVLLVERLRTA